ncbi:MAG: O-antigen ligase family protein, partial [Hyphomicrobiaceae bacterium]
SSIHSGISVYLYLATFVFAAFVARKPVGHSRLVLHAYQWAACVAALAGLAGYFSLFPGAGELFTKFGRATGTFKDPNVYGPFLIPALLYALHQCLTRPLHRIAVPAAMVLLLGFGVLLSFSRGAWFNLAIAVMIYGYCSFICAPTHRQRLKMVALGFAGAALLAGGLIAITQSDAVGRLLEERAQLSQSYDEGPEGRFGGHEKAKRLIIDNPFGIGAGTFTEVFHHEDVHNVYLSMFLNAGWLGGLIFILMCALTTLYGLRHAFKRTASQSLFLIAYAAFVGNVVEGFVIDIDHWRHFYLLMALVWGLMLGDRRVATLKAAPSRPAKIKAPVMIIPARRAPRIVGKARVRLVPLPAPAQRRATLRPRLPNRIGRS